MEKNNITISVVIPVYNVSDFIERCVCSVINQTYTDFECIIVNDASPDDSIAKCEKIIATYEGPIHFRIIHHEYNRGLSAARNTGIEVASGDYILFVDSDDAISPDCIEKLIVPILRDRTVEMVVGDYEIHSVNSLLATPPKKLNLVGDYPTNEEIRYCFYDKKGLSNYAWNRLVKKEFLNRFGITFQDNLLWEDDLWLFYIMKYLNHLYIINDVTYLYYVHPNSITTNTDMKTKQNHLGVIFWDVSNNFTPKDSIREVKYYLKSFCICYFDCSRNALFQDAAQNFRKELSFWHNPLEFFLLSFSICSAKSWFGKNVFFAMRNVYRLLKNYNK